MDVQFSDILRIGFSDGLIWFPFVLGVGLLYTYFKEIDISVDGIAVLSGICCAFTWKITESYFISILAGVIFGIFSSILVCSLQTIFRISGLMAGIVFSLVAHSLSVMIIGESLVLPNTRLISSFGVITWWQIVVTVVLILMTFIFYNTHFGIAARKLGSGCAVNTVYSANLLRYSGYALSGFLYGLGGAIYAHSQGLAKSGGSFEFLLVSLTAYLCTVRIAELLGWILRLLREKISSNKVSPYNNDMVLNKLLSSPAIKALAGAIFFESLLFFTIAVSPNPRLWKLIFALLIFLSLARPEIWSLSFFEKIFKPAKLLYLDIEGLSFHYDIGSEKREVFNMASGKFHPGINLIRGPNGTGKSTLLKAIAGLIKPSAGHMKYNGFDFSRAPQHLRPCFLVQQNPMDTLAKELTVTENLFVAVTSMSPAALGLNPSVVLKKLMSLLSQLGVSPIRPEQDSFWNKPVMTLSGGEAHCVAVYCALVADSSILLADEPTTGLDDENFRRLTTLLRAFATERIVFLTSHDSRVTEFADHLYTVGNGRITAENIA